MSSNDDNPYYDEEDVDYLLFCAAQILYRQISDTVKNRSTAIRGSLSINGQIEEGFTLTIAEMANAINVLERLSIIKDEMEVCDDCQAKIDSADEEGGSDE